MVPSSPWEVLGSAQGMPYQDSDLAPEPTHFPTRFPQCKLTLAGVYVNMLGQSPKTPDKRQTLHSSAAYSVEREARLDLISLFAL